MVVTVLTPDNDKIIRWLGSSRYCVHRPIMESEVISEAEFNSLWEPEELPVPSGTANVVIACPEWMGDRDSEGQLLPYEEWHLYRRIYLNGVDVHQLERILQKSAVDHRLKILSCTIS